MAGEIQIDGVTLATQSGGTINFGSDVTLPYASQSEIFGTHTTFSGSHSDTATTINLASVSGISAGDYVVGEGIASGTTVSSVGASSVVISTGLDTDGVGISGGEPISFYKSNKVLSPGLVAGALCRAWVNFYGGPSSVYIRASHNVSSITDSGTGQYIVNFTTAMPDANYCTNATAKGSAADGRAFTSLSSANATYTTTAVQVGTYLVSTGTDMPLVCVSIFR